MRLPSWFVVLPLCLVPACGTTASVDDTTASLRAGDDGWFVARPDLRKCAAPMCGGFFVARANLARTACLDGTRRAECYVAALDWSATGFSDEERVKLAASPVVFHGRLVDGRYAAGAFADLAVAAVFAPATAPDVDDGQVDFAATLYRAFDNGTRCITWPCPSTTQETLNTSDARAVAGVDLSWSCANDRQLAAAYDALATSDGLLVDGWDEWTRGPGGTQRQLTGVNFWLRVVPAGVAAAE